MDDNIQNNIISLTSLIATLTFLIANKNKNIKIYAILNLPVYIQVLNGGHLDQPSHARSRTYIRGFFFNF